MLTISSGYNSGYLTSEVATGRENYYLDAVADGEPPGVWWGAGADALGLAGEVDAEVMSAVFDELLDPTDERFADPETRDQAARLGRAPMQARPVDEVLAKRVAALAYVPLPEQVETMRAEIERTQRQAVMFFDLTFSVPKSVSVGRVACLRAEVAARKAGDEQGADEWGRLRQGFDDAILAANAAALDAMWAEAGFARAGTGGAMHYVRGKWVVAQFKQHTSRNLDPQAHVHNALLNRMLCEDGVWRTPDSKGLHAAIQYGGAVGELVLAEQLARRGLASVIREDGNGRELAAVDPAVNDVLSSRRADMNAILPAMRAAAEERLGRELTGLEARELAQSANLVTRKAKSHVGHTDEQIIDRAHDAARAVSAGGLERTAARILAESESGVPPLAATFSERAVMEQAVAECQEGGSSFTRGQLARHITMALPNNLGGLDPAQCRRLVDALVEATIASGELVQVSGRDLDVPLPAALRREDGASVYTTPSGARYAARWHLRAEEALRRAAVTRGRLAAPAEGVDAWLAARAGQLGPDQAAAVHGIATSDAALTVLVGPAGTGKSHTAAALAGVWADTTGGRVVGLAVSQAATEVLRDDGLADSANVAAFLAAQQRLTEGRPIPGDERWRIGVADVVLVDEASMVATAHMTAVREVVEAAGGRLVLTGDPAQLGAVGAGGMMAVLADETAETYTLGDVRRFAEDWERAASLRLRDGDTGVLRAYDRRGRLLDCGTADEALDDAARAWVGDTLMGRESIIVTATNEQAGIASRLVRDRLVALGRVDGHGVILGRDGNLAGTGDLVQCRRNDLKLNVTNRGRYVVEAVAEDGSLTVRAEDGSTRTLPAEYVAEDVQLGYASTAHASQGRTVDTAHVVAGPDLDGEALYVGLTRGRVANTAHTITVAEADDGQERRRAVAVLADAMERDPDGRQDAAVRQDSDDLDRLASAATVARRIEDGVRIACRARMENDLDQLAHDGTLTERDRARLAADQGTEYLSRLLRRAEQAGHDPAEVLRDAVRDPRGLVTAKSAAQVLAGRITDARDLTTGPDTAVVPAGIHPDAAECLARLHERLDDRRRDLGAEVGQDAPGWAVAALGPVPDDVVGRLEWEDRAASIAAHREAAGWTDPDVPIGPPPGLHCTEARSGWQAAREALGGTEAHADLGVLTAGQLRARIAAGERVRAHLPAQVQDDTSDARRRAERARQDAAAAAEAGDQERADQAAADAELAELVASHLDVVADVRADALVAHAATLAAAQQAAEEATLRGLPARDRAEQVTAEEWLEADASARVEDDQHRAITEADLLDHDQATDVRHAATEQATSTEQPPTRTVPVTALEAEALAVEASAVAEQLADIRSQDAGHLGTEHLVDDVAWEHWTEQQAEQEAVAADDYAA